MDEWSAILASSLGGFVSFVLVQAIVGKIRDIDSFTIVTLGGLGFSSRVARPIAAAVLILEVAAVIAISTAVSVGAAVILGLILFLAFAAVGAYAAVARISVTCGCFGAGRGTLGLRTVWRSLLLALVVAACGVAGWVGHPVASLTVLLSVMLVGGKWWVDWQRLSRPLGWRHQ